MSKRKPKLKLQCPACKYILKWSAVPMSQGDVCPWCKRGRLELITTPPKKMQIQIMKPVGLQLSRKKGFDLQKVSVALNGLPAVSVARPSRWGNPFVVHYDPLYDYSPQTPEEAVKMFSAHVDNELTRIKIRKHLRGKNLACYCPLGTPCHRDVLLEIAK
jgi:hypothetical protein